MPAVVMNSIACPPLPDLILEQEKVHQAVDGAGHDVTIDRLNPQLTQGCRAVGLGGFTLCLDLSVHRPLDGHYA